MANVEAASGFLRGFEGTLATVRQRKMQDEDRAAQKDSLAYAKQRQQVLDQRSDTQFQQQQQDRAQQQSELQAAQLKKQQDLQKQAEHEGVGFLADAVEQGADPRMIEQQFSSMGSGEWGIQPGTLEYDKNTTGDNRVVKFVGNKGMPITTTVGLLRSRFGIGNEKPIALADGGMLVTPKGKVLTENPKAGSAKNDYREFDTTKDVYKINADGTRTLVSKGVPKASEDDGSKTSPYNKLSQETAAIKVVNDSYRKKIDERGQIVWEQPEDSVRQLKASDFIGGFFAEKQADGQKYGAGEIGKLAATASSVVLSPKEAGAKAVTAGLVEGTPAYNREVARLLRDSDTKAAQVWAEGIDAIEAKREAKEKKANGGKRPLKDILGE